MYWVSLLEATQWKPFNGSPCKHPPWMYMYMSYGIIMGKCSGEGRKGKWSAEERKGKAGKRSQEGYVLPCVVYIRTCTYNGLLTTWASNYVGF